MTTHDTTVSALTIEDIQRIRLEPGDILALRCDYDLDREEVARIEQQARAMLPEGTDVMVLSGGLRLEGVVTPPHAA